MLRISTFLVAFFAVFHLMGQATVIFTETFEMAGAPSLSPQWVWSGNAPTPVTDRDGGWGVRKEVRNPANRKTRANLCASCSIHFRMTACCSSTPRSIPHHQPSYRSSHRS